MGDIVTITDVFKPWHARKGADNLFNLNFTYNGSALNMATYTISAYIKEVGEAADTVLTLTQGSGFTNNGATGVINGVISVANTANLRPNTYFMLIKVVDPDGYTFGVINSSFKLYDEIYSGDITTDVDITVTLAGTEIDVAVTFPGGSSGGAATWGTITGTLSAQTDLQSALDAKTTAAAAAAAAQTIADAKVAQTITDGVTISAPSQNAVYDALVLKAGITVNRIRGTTNNRFHGSQGAPTTLTTQAGGTNSLRATPFRLQFPAIVDTVAMEITTGTSGNLIFGIYADDGDGYPAARLYQSANQSISAPAIKSETSLSISLSPGLYWLAYVSDTANTYRAIPQATMESAFVMGYPSTVGAVGGGQVWLVAHTFGSMPTPFTAGATIGTGSPQPAVLLRLIAP